MLNAIFGWPFFNDHRTEMELFDLILFFGLLGVACYVIFFIKFLKGKNSLTYFMVISLIIGAILSGNLLASVNVMVLLFLTVKYLNIKEKIWIKNHLKIVYTQP